MSRFRIFAFASVILGAAAGPVTVYAHIKLMDPPSVWVTEDGGKGKPPCGQGFPSNIVTKVQGGHPLAVKILEWIGHPGHYRLALAGSREKLPPDPEVEFAEKDGIGGFGPKSVKAAIDSSPKPPILLDGAFAHTTNTRGVQWNANVMIPNMTCEKCTLQVVEFMAEHPGDSAEQVKGGGVFYHACTDLSITVDASLPAADKAWLDLQK